MFPSLPGKRRVGKRWAGGLRLLSFKARRTQAHCRGEKGKSPAKGERTDDPQPRTTSRRALKPAQGLESGRDGGPIVE